MDFYKIKSKVLSNFVLNSFKVSNIYNKKLIKNMVNFL